MNPEQLAGIFLGRQPILDRELATIGYELLFRDSLDNNAHLTDRRAATADVVCKAFAELGIANALGAQRAFINVDHDFLNDDAIGLLPPGLVVLELGAEQPLSEDLLARCHMLKGQGYAFSLSGMHGTPDSIKPLRPLASYFRVNVDTLPADQIRLTGSALRSPATKLIAGRVESEAVLKECKDAGFDYFQGYFFAKPDIIEGRKLDASTHALLRIIGLLNDEADVFALETAFKAEPALSINLLRLTNSVGVGLSVRVASVRHAITVMGRKQLSRWMQLLLFNRPGANAGIGHNPLMQWAAMRGYFMELLAGRFQPTRKDFRDQAFLAGIMSLMPIALGIPMTEILAQITVTPEVRQALARKEGEMGQLMALTEAYDDGDLDACAAICRKLGGRLTLQSLSLCLTEAIAWVQELSAEAA